MNVTIPIVSKHSKTSILCILLALVFGCVIILLEKIEKIKWKYQEATLILQLLQPTLKTTRWIAEIALLSGKVPITPFFE